VDVRRGVRDFADDLHALLTESQLGAASGWPGAGVYPPQPMVGQRHDVLRRYRAAGGRYEEHVLADRGHSPHLEKPVEFQALIADFLPEAAAADRA